MDHLTIFDELYPRFKITKPIRLIEFFAGYGSQALALKYLGVKFEHWKICEWAVKSIQAYKDIHTTDNTDYSKDLSKEELIDYLHNKGISSNYNEPMNYHNIFRLSEDNLRTIYNNIIATHNLVNIQQVKGKDLEIVDKDKYDYILTYSFPCQDLSLAGKGKGMSDTSTRSGMLWEVERILKELKETDSLPQVLLMENVPQVHSVDNTPDFNKWQIELTKLGYKNYWEDLIATDYGIPQTRNRCFMVSILGDYNYTFPKPIPLEKKLKDMLEDNVDEKYFLSDKMKEYIFSEDDKYKVNKNSLKLNREIACSKTTREGWTRADTSDYILVKNATKENNGVVVNSLYTDIEKQLFTEDGNIKRYLNSDIVDKFEEGQMATTTFPNGYGHGPRTHNESIALNTIDKPSVKHNLRIRKLTPKECFRLQGVKDEDYEKCAKNQSDSSLYHLAGDSLITTIMMALFGQMMDINWVDKYKSEEWWNNE